MSLRRRLQAFSLLVLLTLPHVVAAEDECFSRVAGEMAAVHNEYRSHLFGSRKDTDGKNIVLTGGETNAVRTGIFETKGRLTSELVEPIVDSYRVYRCRTLSVCRTLDESFGVDGGTVDLRQLGCEPTQAERYEECYLAGKGDQPEQAADLQSEGTALLGQCQALAEQTLAAERSVLKLAVAYDSGYRALLQFVGMIDWVLTDFPTQTVKAIADMVNVLGKLHQIPCFIGQCDAPDTASLGQ